MKPKIAVIYDAHSTMTNTVREHVNAFSDVTTLDTYLLRKENIKASVVQGMDGLVLHYSCRLAFPETLGKHLINILERFPGPIYVFIQDEYDNTEMTRTALDRIAPQIVFTCVPEAHIEQIYPQARFPSTDFVNVLTGFAPSPEDFDQFGMPYANRTIDIGYRGRTLGYQYGVLGQEKAQIGVNVLQDSRFSTLSLDISLKDSDRIYGDAWNSFLSNCKAVLGTESGSNLFDFSGQLKSLANSCSSFKEFQSKLPIGINEFDFMGQISPRIFEAAALHVANILYPGSYSGLLTPWVHFIPLERDHSNAEQVINFLSEEPAVARICDNAYADLIQRGTYSKRAFTDFLQHKISPSISKSNLQISLHHNLEREVKIQSAFLDVWESKWRDSKRLISFWHSLPFQFRIEIYRRINQIYQAYISRRG